MKTIRKILIINYYNIGTDDIMCLNEIAKSIVVTKPIQNNDPNYVAVKQNTAQKVQPNFNTGSTRYAPQKVENKQYHSRAEDSSAKVSACLNRQSSTLIYSSDNGDLGVYLFLYFLYIPQKNGQLYNLNNILKFSI